jgi:HSP20 family molecular chaperone IbpA
MKREPEKVNVNRAAPAGPSRAESYAPLVDIYEDAQGTVVLVAELPGVTPEKLDMRVDKGVLTIEADGTLPEMPDTYSRTYTGFRGASYFRAFALSDELDREKIEASLKDGLLTVRLPKAAAAQSRKIEIKG